ncbi:hypothetical protein GCM10009745_71860 [Kribbella yunnanensis]|uniref:Lantibiotic dehydratase N-terminal domain-containing protein n=1 Tax=Kribbella yunnanensis TaxID=190194 RepID=A0ABN2IWI9_9ACTN
MSNPNSTRIGESDWTLWPTAMVRSAGFPADAVLRLADERLANLADQACESDEYLAAWDEAAENTGKEVAIVAESERFRLAVTWQNPQFLDNAVDAYLRHFGDSDPGNSRTRARRRSREAAIATYWQRYCLKNESIGFFGPTAWATVGGDSELTAEPGPALVAKGTVHLERWAVDTLARTLAAKFDLRPWLRPRRSPVLRIEGNSAGLAGGATEPIDPVTVAALTLADGATTARQIARQLVETTDLDTEAEAFEQLERLRRKRWLVWRLDLPTSLTPEEDLLALLEGIDDPAVRAETTDAVTQLIEGRRHVQAVWDQPVKLRQALDSLAQVFERLTGSGGTRNAGKAYGGRTLAFLECRRDVTVGIGDRFVDKMRPITGVLDSIRWLTWQIRQELEGDVRAAYRSGRSRNPSAEGVDVATFWGECTPVFGRLDKVVKDAMAEFHRRWDSVLAFTSDEQHMAYTAAELETPLKLLFDAPRPGWTQAVLSCPDLMVAAGSEDDVRAGRYTLVLGEVHPALNSMDYISLVPHHPNPTLLHAGLDDAFPEPRLLPVLPTESKPPFTARSHPALHRANDQRLVVMPQTPPPPEGMTVLGADAMVCERDGQLVVTTPGQATAFDVFDLFAETLKSILLRHFGLFPVKAHRPRITVDNVVLAREGWRVAAGDMDFARVTDAPQRFAATRQFAAELGLPRFVFVKSPVETKPFYVDFASPVLVEMLAASVRRTASTGADGDATTLTFTEMTPGPDELWLADADSGRYTCELRFAARDCRDLR